MTGILQVLPGGWRRSALLAAVLCSGAFGQSVGIDSPQSGEVISGNYTMSGGWSLDSSTVSGVEVWLGGSSLCCAGWSDSGWSLSFDTTTVSQGPGQTVSVQVDGPGATAQTSGVIVDQPPGIQLMSAPADGVMNGNDGDRDYLVETVPVAPTTTMIDSVAVRPVCNEYTPDGIGTLQSAAYMGDASFDLYGVLPDGSLDKHLCPLCNYVWYAKEEDAIAFASSKAGP